MAASLIHLALLNSNDEPLKTLMVELSVGASGHEALQLKEVGDGQRIKPAALAEDREVEAVHVGACCCHPRGILLPCMPSASCRCCGL
jgi:hypothetical protein